jgi:hypothetical protein
MAERQTLDDDPKQQEARPEIHRSLNDHQEDQRGRIRVGLTADSVDSPCFPRFPS